jgi:hypothetical protein
MPIDDYFLDYDNQKICEDNRVAQKIIVMRNNGVPEHTIKYLSRFSYDQKTY